MSLASASPVRQCVHRPEPSAVSRKPTAFPDALVYDLYGLTKEEIEIVEGNP